MLNCTTIETMTDQEVNNAFPIKNTQYNRNCRYSDRVKETWKKMYSEGYGIKIIAMIWNCNPSTVRMVVDSDYRNHISELRKSSNKAYYESHTYMRTKYNTSKTDLAEYKRSILSSSALAHLQAI